VDVADRAEHAVTAALAAATAGLAVLVLAPRDGPSRVAQLRQRATDPRNPVAPWWRSGRALDRLVAPASGPAPDPRSAPRTTLALVAATVATPFLPPALAGVVAWRWAAPRLQGARRDRQRTTAVTEELPDVIDLLRLANGAGLSLALALPLVARRSAGVVGEALGDVEVRVAAGQARADALLTALEPLGDAPASLGHALADHLRHGTALEPVLDRLAFEARTARRHRAEQAARRVPVRLLLPLVACILPAFGLLTVVPLLAGSLRSLAG
jgi:tight adherence protein C